MSRSIYADILATIDQLTHAEAVARQVVSVAEQTGDEWAQIGCQTSLCDVLLRRGASEEALSLAQQTHDLAGHVDDPALKSMALMSFGASLLANGNAPTAAGTTNAEIGEALFISPFTAKTHVANLLGTLQVENRASATRWAAANGVI